MSQVSGTNQFSFGLYGTDQLAMDWYGLADPYTVFVPIEVSNNWSGTFWFQGQLNSPASRYSAYSGIQLGSVAGNATGILAMSWNAAVSGFVQSSSPVQESLTLALFAFTSSNYTGAYNSGSITVSSISFSVVSGMIKLFGDSYTSGEQVSFTPVEANVVGGTISSGQTYSYALAIQTYSGWLADVGPSNSATITLSGNNGFSMTLPIPSGAFGLLFRWSGSASNGSYSNGALTAITLLTVISGASGGVGLSYQDAGTAGTGGWYAHTDWQTTNGTGAPYDTSVFLSGASSIKLNSQALWSHSFYVGRYMSGPTSTGSPLTASGPIFASFNIRPSANNQYAVWVETAPSTNSGYPAFPLSVFNTSGTLWYRHVVSLGAWQGSGEVATIQVLNNTAGNINVDEMYVVSIS